MREKLNQLIAEMLEKGIHYEDAQREFERRFITGALARSRGNLSHAAKSLGLHRNTLSRKVAQYLIKPTPLKVGVRRHSKTRKSAS